MLEVPDAGLAWMVSVMLWADYLEQLEVISACVLVTSVEIYEAFGWAQRQDAFFFIKCHAKDVGGLARDR